MILITGGTGFLGAHLLFKLLNEKQSVRAIYRNEKKLEHVKHIFSYYTEDADALFNAIDWVKADLNDIPSLSEAFKSITHVYHCAAFVSFEPDKFDRLQKTNIEGTANIVNLCISENIKKLCYVSSIAAIGASKLGIIATEETEWNPEADNSVYAITKYGAELEVWRGTQEGVDAVIVNPGVIIGPGIWAYGSGSIFKTIYKGATYYTSGTIALVAVDDVVKSMMQLMKSKLINERFILVAENWTYKKFMKTIADALNTQPPEKEAKIWLLQLGWRLDWLTYQLFGKRRKLTKQLAHSLVSKTEYSSSKLKTHLKTQFASIHESIRETASLFLKDKTN
ncbi:NAD-dependent epimerase/dehydratase family protein [Lacinutrix sp. Hel_I_90]|uniref:NAD-dependent epimerase/dehydratase family protein n=1 Tax=Lacinutrix sp. Hel_I_90 TaxID=1249999 RepID=UPI0005C89F29|nr:NAD-dependent epimerase/dehydratase family protein [Lacinutrix sp. Hel_I_90]